MPMCMNTQLLRTSGGDLLEAQHALHAGTRVQEGGRVRCMLGMAVPDKAHPWVFYCSTMRFLHTLSLSPDQTGWPNELSRHLPFW